MIAMAITRALTVLSAALAAVTLGGCGGRSGEGVASQPPPPVAPPPPPPPVPAYVPFSDATELQTNAFGLSGDITITQAADGNYVIASVDYRPFAVGPGTNDYAFAQPSPGHLQMNVHGFGGSYFELADGGELFDQRGYASIYGNEVLQVSQPGVGLDLTYTRFGNYTWGGGVDEASPGYISFLTLGVPTSNLDMPTSGTASYNGFVDGLWSDGLTSRRLFGSTATMAVDFSTGNLSTTLALTGRDNPFGDFLISPATYLGTFSGSGTIASNWNSFSGAFTPQDGWTGSFAGSFYGPQAGEYGYVFGLSNSNGGAASGSVVGERN
jgi:hypothetical protein